MGLCKCPRKVVTPLFCYEHRVNVCQGCMVVLHRQCVVQAYLEWLQDAQYNPSCTICSEPLRNEECIRLECLHIFHWRCLNQMCKALPPTTAPSGFGCPNCGRRIFPNRSSSTPIAIELRRKLTYATWGQKDLDNLSIVTNDTDTPLVPPEHSAMASSTSTSGDSDISIPSVPSVTSLPIRRAAPAIFQPQFTDADDDKYSRLPEIPQGNFRNRKTLFHTFVRRPAIWGLSIYLIYLIWYYSSINFSSN